MIIRSWVVDPENAIPRTDDSRWDKKYRGRVVVEMECRPRDIQAKNYSVWHGDFLIGEYFTENEAITIAEQYVEKNLP